MLVFELLAEAAGLQFEEAELVGGAFTTDSFSSQVPMFMLCFIGGGGTMESPDPTLLLGFGFSNSLPGFLAMTAQEIA